MKVPYSCPYCNSQMEFNTHIRRKHQREDNPFEMGNRIPLTDTYSQLRPVQSQSDFSNSFWAQIDWSDPVQVMERITKFNVL